MERRNRTTMGSAATDAAGDRVASTQDAYAAARAAHMIEEFLEERTSLEALEAWLRGYPSHARVNHTPQLDDEINHATLALRALRENTRTWRQVHEELKNIRSRLTGLARF